jgi:hypothetical protein
VWLASRPFVGIGALVPGAVTCAAVVGLEVLAASEALGAAYDRLDLMTVERAE